jgi:hypothetical protein
MRFQRADHQHFLAVPTLVDTDVGGDVVVVVVADAVARFRRQSSRQFPSSHSGQFCLCTNSGRFETSWVFIFTSILRLLHDLTIIVLFYYNCIVLLSPHDLTIIVLFYYNCIVLLSLHDLTIIV